MIKKIIGRLLNKKTGNPASSNFIGSTISKPYLVDPSARIHYSEIAGNVKIGKRCLLHKVQVSGTVEIGNYTSLNGPNTDIFSLIHPVTIGSYCSIARNTSFQEFTHDYSRATSYFIFKHLFEEKSNADVISKGPITLGNDVWIGTHSVILSGVTIGHGAVIASNSVVSTDIPPYAIAGGSPAKVIRYRFEEPVIKKLLDMEWWNWPHDRIERNREFFEGTLTMEKLDRISL